MVLWSLAPLIKHAVCRYDGKLSSEAIKHPSGIPESEHLKS